MVVTVKHNGVEYTLNKKKIQTMWKDLFKSWAQDTPWVPEKSKLIFQDMLAMYEKNNLDITKIPPDTLYIWVRETLRMRANALSYYRDDSRKKLPVEDQLDILLQYYMWDLLNKTLSKGLTKEQLIHLNNDPSFLKWSKATLTPVELDIGTVYFFRVASGYEVPIAENFNNNKESEKMKQFLEVVEPNFFTILYDIFDFNFYFFGFNFYFLDLIFLFSFLIIFFYFFFFKFLNKLFTKLKSNNFWKKFF